MKYQTEYQRNYQKKFHEPSVEERKLNEVPIKRSTSRRRGRSLPNRNNLNDSVAIIGPNDKFSQSQFYRLKQPVKDYPRVRKSPEYALLGRNEKFSNNIAYPLRKPVISDSPRVVVRRRKNEKHSCGSQTELDKTTNYSRYKRETDPNRKRFNPQSEYKQQYINWKKTASDDQLFIKDSKFRERRSDPPPVSTSVAVNTPARVEIDVNKTKQPVNRPVTRSAKVSRPKRDESTEYRTSYKPFINPKKPKSFEAEQINERKRKEIEIPERAYSDDEGINRNVDLGNEFRQKYPHGKLRRWKSEYQSTYKPFWRFDYKNGKWYKDTAADETGFNPNLFWYKELMSTRKRADQFRANAEEDHFNSNHTLQLQTGFNLNNNYQAWDTDDDDSVISIDRDLERERIEGERRREKDAKRIYPKKSNEKPSTVKTDQISQTEHQVDRIVYIDEPPPKQPSLATKAFVRNLGSSAVQQHMSWDSQSFSTQRTNSDRDSHRKYHNNIIRPTSSKKIGTHSPLPSEQQPKNLNNEQINPKTSHHESTHATGRPSYDTHTVDKRPSTTMNQYCTYPGSRFKDEVTEYYYGSDDNRHTPVSKSSFDNHLETLDERYGRTYNKPNKDDDVISVNSVRSLSSSCSLASQTLERAQQNMNKYWGDNSPSSPKKPYSAKH